MVQSGLGADKLDEIFSVVGSFVARWRRLGGRVKFLSICEGYMSRCLARRGHQDLLVANFVGFPVMRER